jgi:MoaA/NifB/PqqE/SkfB family radical SAM enzyme
MVKIKEITFELTDFCEMDCKFCSSAAVKNGAIFLELNEIKRILMYNDRETAGIKKNETYDRINLSGGEPLAHSQFYDIYKLCEQYTNDVVVYSNLITHRRYNAHAIDGVYLEADITVTPETDAIHVLKRVKQGREANRPEVSLSRNHEEDCSCDHKVVRPWGSINSTPCNKYEEAK